MTIKPEVALSVALAKIDEAVARMEEARRFAHEFDDRMRPLIAEVKLLKKEVAARWQDYLRATGPT